MRILSFKYLPQLTFGMFLVPATIFSLGGVLPLGGDAVYRGSQILEGLIGVLAVFMLRKAYDLRLSATAKLIAFLVLWSAVVHLFMLALSYKPDFSLVRALVGFQVLLILLPLDILARRYTFEEFAQAAAPVAMFLVVASWINIHLFGTHDWGRYRFFGWEAPVGGEIVFGCLCILAFQKQFWVRYVFYGLGFMCLFMMQTRASMISSAMVILAREFPLNPQSMQRSIVGVAALLAVIAVALLVSPQLLDWTVDFIENDILQVNSKSRGSGTGFVGREDTWIFAAEQINLRPLFGTGVGNSATSNMGYGIHNGYLATVSELGVVMGTVANLLLLVRFIQTIRVDHFRAGVIAGCLFSFMFNSRSIATNVYPLILWVAILPWAVAPRREAATQRPDAPAERDRPITA